MKETWTLEDMPKQNGKTVLITGANDGLGFHMARAFAAKDAGVVLMACRNLKKAASAVSAILSETPRANLEVFELDLADLGSVDNCAEAIGKKHGKLDIVMCNAGLMAVPYGETKNGLEMQMGVNYYGHYALVGRLLPLIKNTPGARVVTTASVAEKLGRLDLTRPVTRSTYNRWRAYGDSKLAMIVFANVLDRKFKQYGVDAMALSAHPGSTKTNLRKTRLETEKNPWQRFQLKFHESIAMRAERGILPLLYAATDPDARGGQYIGLSGFLEARGHPRVSRGQKRAYDAALGEELWRKSEQVTGVVYQFDQAKPRQYGTDAERRRSRS
jgi:NAD(P)-dependent dehydrogenase (short-subunit alcohol dehydrogenase family)